MNLFERAFERPQKERPDGVVAPLFARRDLKVRLLGGGIALFLYGGLILLAFHEPTRAHENGVGDEMTEFMLYAILGVWIVANAALIVFGNAVISTISCVIFWWLAFYLSQPDWTPKERLIAQQSDQIDGYVFLPVFGFFNLMLLLAAHIFVYLKRENPAASTDKSADPAA